MCRPACASRAITPPQPNSMSSGCAPNTMTYGGISNAATAGRLGLASDFSVRFIGSVNRVAVDECDFRGVGAVEVGLLAGSGDVVRAMNHGLHPAQTTIASRCNLLFGEWGG